MGGIDWAGLPAVLALHAVPDESLELLLDGLSVIKTHRPDTPGQAAQ